MIAYIPARGGSKRVPRKNVRNLAGTPVIARTIANLLQLDFITKIYVSTDDKEVRQVAEAAGGHCLDYRAPELSNDKAGFIDLIHYDVERHGDDAGGDRQILFVLATACLVPPDIYRKAHKIYQDREPEILMSCEPFHSSPFWSMVRKPDGFWEPLFPEKVFINSQDLPETLIDAGLFYFFDLETMKAYPSVKLVDRLMAFEMPHDYAVDVDSPRDWDRLEEKFAKLNSRGYGDE
jgi:pseudaminic acid cytidylyltransferase